MSNLIESIVTIFKQTLREAFRDKNARRLRQEHDSLADFCLPRQCINPAYIFHSKVFLPSEKKNEVKSSSLASKSDSNYSFQPSISFFSSLDYGSSLALYLCFYFIFRAIIFSSKRAQRLAHREKKSLFLYRLIPFFLIAFTSCAFTSSLFYLFHPHSPMTYLSSPLIHVTTSNSLNSFNPALTWYIFVTGFISTVLSIRYHRLISRFLVSMTSTGELFTLTFGAVLSFRFLLQLFPPPMYFYFTFMVSLSFAFLYQYLSSSTSAVPSKLRPPRATAAVLPARLITSSSSLSSSPSIAEAAKSLKKEFRKPTSPILQKQFEMESLHYEQRQRNGKNGMSFSSSSSSLASSSSSSTSSFPLVFPTTIRKRSLIKPPSTTVKFSNSPYVNRAQI